MKIVQHQDKVFMDFIVDLIDEGDQQPLHPLFQDLQAIEGRSGAFAELGEAFGQRGDEVSNKDRRVSIERIKRQPAERQVAVMRQVNQQGGFAVASRSRNHDQLAVEILVQRVQQTLAAEKLNPALGQIGRA